MAGNQFAFLRRDDINPRGRSLISHSWHSTMITGVILAHNEEHNILQCIAALRPHVGELFLIDTESTDQTAELARPHVDRILSHPNIPNFDAVRNIAIPEGGLTGYGLSMLMSVFSREPANSLTI